jgi:hypothetical protein
MDPTTTKIAWIAIAIGALMQVLASFLPGADGLVEPFQDVEPVTSIGSFFDWAGDVGLGVIDVLFGFLQQSWAQDFPLWLRWSILVVFDLALLLLVASNTPLLIIAGVAALAAALDALIEI